MGRRAGARACPRKPGGRAVPASWQERCAVRCRGLFLCHCAVGIELSIHCSLQVCNVTRNIIIGDIEMLEC